METRSYLKHWGAEYVATDTVRFRLWATGQNKVKLRLSGKETDMQPTGNGWFEQLVSGVLPGAEYQFVLADGMTVPDPASRAQRDDVDGPSLVIDPTAYVWQNTQWSGRRWEETVVYELHIGTFTPQGTFQAAAEKLPYLAELGITMIEVLPVAQFGGRRGWGYDGVLLYAPHAAYGTPDDFKAFIDAAHGYGISVVLDIVLNHFGPQGNYLPLLSPDFFHPERMTPWGAGIAHDVEAVRQYIAEAPLYWLREFNLDGLRFDAIDQIEDTTDPHILIEIAQRIRAELPERPIHLTTEDCRNVIFLHPRDADGNAPRLTVNGMRALTEGFVYQGEVAVQSGEARGVDSRGQPPAAFFDFLQNHDQVGNRAQGDRLITLTGADRNKVLLATLLLSPHIPLLLMGEEYGETNPFLFFTDFHGDLARAVREGRAREFEGHAGHEGEVVPDPNAETTFTRSKLDWHKPDSAEGKAWLALTRQLLTLRQNVIVPLLGTAGGHAGQVLKTAPGFVAVSWTFPRGQLSIALNIGATTQPCPPARQKDLHSTPSWFVFCQERKNDHSNRHMAYSVS
ncbi:malto-oligosyltrehalose trehalohydrolase [Erwinia sp. MYb416]|uniref:malto-oligosyltrehalose trehalohydrolase n=1 Tax=Erwinia sp. MYb416 TaxID=3108532 RepID=UPI0030AA234B